MFHRVPLMLLCLSLLANQALTSVESANVDEVVLHGNREDIVRIFDFAIKLVDQFRAEDNIDTQQKLRRLIEGYHESILMPAYRRSIQLLSRNKDKELMRKTMGLVVAEKDSADEEFSFGLGKIFEANPKLFESVYFELSSEDKSIIYERLGWGVKNILDQEKQSRRAKFLEKNLLDLKP